MRLREKVVAGTARLEPGEGIIGIELAADLGLRPGDRLTVLTGTVSETVRVTALVDLGVRELNRRTVIVPLRLAQSLLGLPGGATSLDLALVDVWAAKDMAADLRRQFPYQVESWQETNAQLVSALNAQSVSTGLIRIIVLIVVEVGLITPPVGMNLFVINSMAKDIPIARTYRGVTPFIICQVITLLVVFFWPPFATWLPSVLVTGF